jgi:hypothetical protein
MKMSPNRRNKLPQLRKVSELVDPRPHDGGRLLYQDMPLLPVSYECDWMRGNEVVRRAVVNEIYLIACEGVIV